MQMFAVQIQQNALIRSGVHLEIVGIQIYTCTDVVINCANKIDDLLVDHETFASCKI